MQSSGGYGRLVVVAAGLSAGIGCGVGGGTLTGTGGSSTAVAGHGGSHSVIVGTAGAGQPPLSGTGGRNQCGDIPQPIPRLFPAIMIVLDTSASMNDPIDASCTANCQSKWAAAVAGVNTVVDPTSTPDVGWGLSFIGGGATDACDLGSIGSLVGVNDSLALPLARVSKSDGTLAAIGDRPTRGAIERAAQLLAAEGAITPRLILLITDGRPGCKPGEINPLVDDATGTQSAISTALASGTVTSVVGLAILSGPADVALSDLAIAGGGPVPGGGPAYFPASSSGDVVSAMKTVLASMECMYPVPAPPNNDGTTSRSDISVVAGTESVPQDANNGWTYTDATQTAIQLHGTSCANVRATGVAISIIFNCYVG